MPVRLSVAQALRLGRQIGKQNMIRDAIEKATGIAFSIDTWRQIPQRITVKLKPEDQAQLAIMNWCRAELKPGWIAFHVPAEANRSKVVWALLRVIGFFAGFPDILLIAPGGRCFLIEVKRADQKPKLSPAQEAFRAWADAFKVPYLVAQTPADIEMWLTARESDS